MLIGRFGPEGKAAAPDKLVEHFAFVVGEHKVVGLKELMALLAA